MQSTDAFKGSFANNNWSCEQTSQCLHKKNNAACLGQPSPTGQPHWNLQDICLWDSKRSISIFRPHLSFHSSIKLPASSASFLVCSPLTNPIRLQAAMTPTRRAICREDSILYRSQTFRYPFQTSGLVRLLVLILQIREQSGSVMSLSKSPQIELLTIDNIVLLSQAAGNMNSQAAPSTRQTLLIIIRQPSSL